MAFCHQCGNQLSTGAEVCTTCKITCGADSEVPVAPEPEATPQTFEQFSRMPPFREMVTRLQSEKDVRFLYDDGRPAFPDSAITANGRLDVDDLLVTLASALPGYQAESVVTLTARDLEKSGCGSLFGYADRSRRICVVSTARLGSDPEEIAPRLENVIRHELGHLRGMSHCHQTGCLMKVVTKAKDLDQRSDNPCPRCRRQLAHRGSRVLHRVAAALLLVAVLVSMNLAATLLEPAPYEPFSFSPAVAAADLPDGAPAAERHLIFDGTPLIASTPVSDPGDAAAELNRLFQLLEPPRVSVAAQSTDDFASIFSENREILQIRDPEAPAKARRIAARINALLESKGTSSSSCADCHRDRKDEVLQAAAQRQAGIGIGPF